MSETHSTESWLEVRELKKTYRSKKSGESVEAVRGVSFNVQKGHCFGLLGPNGAGKTTTIEMMENLIKPDQGEVIFRGETQVKPTSKGGGRSRGWAQLIGIQFQQTALQDFLRTGELVRLFASLYPGLDVEKASQRVIASCRLEEFINREPKKLSGGQRQRVLLALALVHDPEIVFLDEPTTGLDPKARRDFWDLVESIKAQGKTLLLTTHYMDEAERLCDEIAIVDRGLVIEKGTPSDLLRQHEVPNLDSLFLKLTGRGLSA